MTAKQKMKLSADLTARFNELKMPQEFKEINPARLNLFYFKEWVIISTLRGNTMCLTFAHPKMPWQTVIKEVLTT